MRIATSVLVISPIVSALLASTGCTATASAENRSELQSNGTAGSAPATTQPASTAPRHAWSTAPVLVVMRVLPTETGLGKPRLEYAAWSDGIVMYRRDFPEAPQTLMVGRITPEDVQTAVNEMDHEGFFRSEPFKFSPSGTVIMARSKGRANTMTAGSPLGRMAASEAPQSMKPFIELWNTVIDSVMSLRETSDSEDVKAVVDDRGMYRGYDNNDPSATWWISDAGELWSPSPAAEQAPSSSRPAR